jgi:hypothetical protein
MIMDITKENIYTLKTYGKVRVLNINNNIIIIAYKDNKGYLREVSLTESKFEEELLNV